MCGAGTVVAAEIQPQAGQATGYGSHEAKSVVMWLRRHGVYARPLGNVVYLMVTPTTHPSQSRQLLETLIRAIDVYASSDSADSAVLASGGPNADASGGPHSVAAEA